jgi:hypothetical protein
MSESTAPISENLDDAADRASERRSFFLSTKLVLATAGTFQARVRNLSAGGMMVELEAAPQPEWAPGDPVSAELQNIGTVRGEIAWAGGRRFGIKFDHEVDPEQARRPSLGPKDVTPDYLRPITLPNRVLTKLSQRFQPR